MWHMCIHYTFHGEQTFLFFRITRKSSCAAATTQHLLVSTYFVIFFLSFYLFSCSCEKDVVWLQLAGRLTTAHMIQQFTSCNQNHRKVLPTISCNFEKKINEKKVNGSTKNDVDVNAKCKASMKAEPTEKNCKSGTNDYESCKKREESRRGKVRNN